MINARKFHGVTTGTVKGIFTESHVKSISPFKKRFSELYDRNGNLPDEIRKGRAPFCIEAIVTEHIEILFRDMDDQFFDELEGAFGDRDLLIVLMTLIPISDIRSIIGNDAGLSHNRSSNVTDDIIDNGISRAKVSRRSIDIETVIFGFVEPVCEGFEIRKREGIGIKSRFHIEKECGHKSASEHGVWEKAYRLPFSIEVKSAFGDDHMYVRVPLEVTPKCMKSANHTGFEVEAMILFIEPI